VSGFAKVTEVKCASVKYLDDLRSWMDVDNPVDRQRFVRFPERRLRHIELVGK
jgi:hypothetical protein